MSVEVVQAATRNYMQHLQELKREVNRELDRVQVGDVQGSGDLVVSYGDTMRARDTMLEVIREHSS